MKLIIAGSRTVDEWYTVASAIEDSPWELRSHGGPFPDGESVHEVVHGGADGVDSIAGKISQKMGVDVKVFEPDWDRHKKAAGPIRNQEMAEYADALIAIWDGESNGTRTMIESAVDEGLEIYVTVVEVDEDKIDEVSDGEVKTSQPIDVWIGEDNG